MCVMSMVTTGKTDDWYRRYYPYTRPNAPLPDVRPVTPWPLPTQQELDEFRRLLDRAREYDQEHNQPDCELEEKRQKLLDLAEQLDVEIDFV